MSKYLSHLASLCQGAAGCLSFDDKNPERCTKRILLEASHALDSQSIRVHKKRDGLLIINARGNCRFLTIRERLAVWLLRGKTEVRP